MEEKLLLEVLIENRQLKIDLDKEKVSSTYWFHEYQKANEKLIDKKSEEVKPDAV